MIWPWVFVVRLKSCASRKEGLDFIQLHMDEDDIAQGVQLNARLGANGVLHIPDVCLVRVTLHAVGNRTSPVAQGGQLTAVNNFTG